MVVVVVVVVLVVRKVDVYVNEVLADCAREPSKAPKTRLRTGTRRPSGRSVKNGVTAKRPLVARGR